MNEQNSMLRLIGTLAAVCLGFLLFWFIGIPVLKFVIALLFGISGFFATIFKYALFVVLSIAALFGILLLVSWIIHEFIE